MNVDDSHPNTSTGTGGGSIPSQPPMYQAIGRYKVLRELGRGAMGVVFEAVDPKIGRKVALKILHDVPGVSAQDAEEFKSRFFREARTAGMLSHPNIVVIHDVDSDEKLGISFMAMEYLKGQTVYDLLKGGVKFTTEQAIDICIQVADGLDHAHRQGIVHRDVKPANLMMLEDGTVKITDFGIAKISTSNLTRTGQFLGTPNYMSPEQVIGHVIDGRSDLFSLGIILYELLTGEKPFMGTSLTTITYQIVNVDPIEPSKIRPGLPKKYDAIAQKLLRKAPDERFQTGKEVAEALRQARDGVSEAAAPAADGSAKPVGAAPAAAAGAAPSPAPASRKPAAARSGPGMPVIVGAAAVAVVAIGIAIWLASRGGETKPPASGATGPPVTVASGPSLPTGDAPPSAPPGMSAPVVPSGPVTSAPVSDSMPDTPSGSTVAASAPRPTAPPATSAPAGTSARPTGPSYDRSRVVTSLPISPGVPAGPTAAPVAAAAPELATLNINVTYKLKEGTFRVLVDNQEKLSQPISSASGKREKGSFSTEIKVADGPHDVRACIESPEIDEGPQCATRQAKFVMNRTTTIRFDHDKPKIGKHYVTMSVE